MEDLKSIETQDPQEKSALDFLTLDKSTWVLYEETEEYKLTHQYIQMENPLTKTPEEKLCFCMEAIIKEQVDKIIKCLKTIILLSIYFHILLQFIFIMNRIFIFRI